MFLLNYQRLPSTTPFPSVSAAGSGSLWLATLAAGLIFSMPAAASLTSTSQPVVGTQNPVTFAQFEEQIFQNDFVFTDSVTGESFGTIPGGIPIFLFFQNVANLPPVLSGPQQATLNFTSTANGPATSGGGTLTEFISGNFSITLDTPFNGRSNLLSATFSNASISGGVGGNNATLSFSTAAAIFTSSFVSFASPVEEDFSLSLTSVQPSFAMGLGGFIANSTAVGTGTFDSNPPPVFTPEPGSLFPMGAGLLGLAWFASRYAVARRR
jgi:hypothetical protein